MHLFWVHVQRVLLRMRSIKLYIHNKKWFDSINKWYRNLFVMLFTSHTKSTLLIDVFSQISQMKVCYFTSVPACFTPINSNENNDGNYCTFLTDDEMHSVFQHRHHFLFSLDRLNLSPSSNSFIKKILDNVLDNALCQGYFYFWHTKSVLETLRHLIKVMRRHDLTEYTRAILETCDLWDNWSLWWENMTWP